MKVSILGSGNGGRALAAAAVRSGACVTLYSRRPDRIHDLQDGELLCEFPPDGVKTYRLDAVTCDLGSAVANADLVILSVPASQHREYAELLGPWRRGLRLVLAPGSFAGTLTFANAWEADREPGALSLSETSTLPYAVRRDDGGVTRVSHQRSIVPYAALIDDGSDTFREVLRAIIPTLSDRVSVLHTALSALNLVMHPPGMLLNAARIECDEAFYFYSEGTSRAVARLIDALDADRRSVADAFGIEIEPFAAAFAAGGYCEEGLDTFQAMRSSPGNQKILAPETLSHRYLTEDVFFGLERMRALADLAGLAIENTRAVIRMTKLVMSEGDAYRHADAWLPRHVTDAKGLLELIHAFRHTAERG